MRILISSQYYHPAYALGGTVVNAVALAEGLTRLGHSVSVVTTTAVDLNGHPAWRSRVEIVRGVTVHYLGTWLSFHKSHVNPPILWFACPQSLDFDVLHIIGLFDSLGPVLAELARRRGMPYGVEPAGMLIPGRRLMWIRRLYHKLVGRRLLKGAQAIVVTSQKEWNDALRFGLEAEQLVLWRNGGGRER